MITKMKKNVNEDFDLLLGSMLCYKNSNNQFCWNILESVKVSEQNHLLFIFSKVYRKNTNGDYFESKLRWEKKLIVYPNKCGNKFVNKDGRFNIPGIEIIWVDSDYFNQIMNEIKCGMKRHNAPEYSLT